MSEAIIDVLLDDLYDVTSRATEWDADQWGFPESWLAAERAAMDTRAGGVGFWPREVSKHELADPPRESVAAGTGDRTTADADR